MMKRLFLLMILGVTSVLCLNAQTTLWYVHSFQHADLL